MSIPQKGEIMKYRRTGNIFAVEKITKNFVILHALDGLTQIMTGKGSFDFLFESVPPSESIVENGSADMPNLRPNLVPAPTVMAYSHLMD